MRAMDLPDGGIKVLTQGMVKGVVNEIITDNETLCANVTPFPFEKSNLAKEQLDRRIREIATLGERVSESSGFLGADFQAILSQMQDPERMVTFVLSHLNLSVEQGQGLLEAESIDELLQGTSQYLNNELETTKIEEQIRTDTREQINKSQREYYLREQLRAIQKELGEESDSELETFKNKIDELKMSEEAKTEALRQIRRLERTSSDSLEATVLRNHLEWLLAMPWGIETKEKIDIIKAKKILDNDHYG